MLFFKYEGLGNDFILVSGKPSLSPLQVSGLCHRHSGVGADGVIFVYRESQHWWMKVFNADGSLAQMCGNGIRCVAQWLFDQGHLVSEIMTDAGLKRCTREAEGWAIDMGVAQIEGNRVSMGNPHLVIQGPVDSKLIDPSVNTEFVTIMNDREIEVVVFERGVGETLACGTGACAAAAFLIQNGLLGQSQEITVHLKGGNLYITARHTDEGLRVQMKGPARFVFEGEVKA
ncbi:MAG: diaminopimelate epimerase [Myxococcota bacterium]